MDRTFSSLGGTCGRDVGGVPTSLVSYNLLLRRFPFLEPTDDHDGSVSTMLAYQFFGVGSGFSRSIVPHSDDFPPLSSFKLFYVHFVGVDFADVVLEGERWGSIPAPPGISPATVCGVCGGFSWVALGERDPAADA